MLEKILIAAPTAAVKNYCIEKWLLNINEFKYPDFELVLVDNTLDKGENVAYLQLLSECLGLKYDVTVMGVKSRKAAGLIERMCESHNLCRQIAIESNYTHWLHLETDIFPPDNVIEQLLCNRKKVCGGLYYRDQGKSRKLMAQRTIFRAHNNAFAMNFTPTDDAWFIDGTVKKIAHIGLGCVLLSKQVFSEIPFRFKTGSDASVDSWFMADCKKNGVDIFADTSIICRHEDSAQVWSDIVVEKIVSNG